eukprot:4828817-Ditylum_brightwellii.AAC.1
MVSEGDQFKEPTSTGVVDDDTTQKVDDDIVTWDDFVSNLFEEIAPKCGGFVLNDDDKLLSFVGTDPDTKAVKGPVNSGQYHPADLKEIKLVEEDCTKYAVTKFDGLASKDGSSPFLALLVYKDIIRKHFIKN